MNRCSRAYKKIMALMLISFIFVVVAISIITPDREFSETENRVLEGKPHFSVNQLLKGSFTSNFEKYITDQFPQRDFWIGIKTDLERLFGRNKNNGVYLGKEGYLIQEFKKPDKKAFDEKMDEINKLTSSISGVDKYFMLVPNSVEILKDKLPEHAISDNQLEYMERVKNSLEKNIKFVDVYGDLNSKKNEYIFYKTDHHWTTKGAYYAYRKLGEVIGFTPKDEGEFNIKKVADNFFGSLYSKSGFRHLKPDTVELYIPKTGENLKVEFIDENKTANSLYNMDSLNKKDKYTVFLGGNHPLIKIKTSNKNGKRILLFKDSYANSFIPFLTSHYSEIYVVDLRYYKEDTRELIKKNKIDKMLFLYNENTFFDV